MVSLAPIARLGIVQGNAEQFVLDTPVIVRLVGKSSTTTLVAGLVDVAELLTTREYVIVCPDIYGPVVVNVFDNDKSTDFSRAVIDRLVPPKSAL